MTKLRDTSNVNVVSHAGKSSKHFPRRVLAAIALLGVVARQMWMEQQTINGRYMMWDASETIDMFSSSTTAAAVTNTEKSPSVFERRLASICAQPPNQGDPDEDVLKYNVLRRIQYFLATKPLAQKNASRIDILCIIPFFLPELEQTAMDTFARDCDSVLVLRNSSNTFQETQSFPIESETKITPLVIVETNLNQETRWKSRTLEFLEASGGSLGRYDWIYWASSDRYPIVGFLRMALLRAPRERTPAMMEMWLIDDLWDFKHDFNLRLHKSDCDTARVWNLQATRAVLPTCRRRRRHHDAGFQTSNTSLGVQCLPSSGMKCLPVQLEDYRNSPSRFEQMMRHFEIATPNGTVQVHRIHAILNGLCDSTWDQQVDALDEQGNPGYVHDPTYLQQHAPKLNLNHSDHGPGGVCGLPLGEGDEGKYGGNALLKIQPFDSPTTPLKKIFCMVYTHEKKHKQVLSVAETWGQKCDGFMAASTKTDPSIGAVNLLHEGPEEYANMWMKVVAMFRYVHKHYINDFDFFHIGGDDQYIIAENLRYTVSTGSWKGPWNQSEPLYLGGPLAGRKGRFCGGGSGYTMNAVALRLLVEKLLVLPSCNPHWKGPQEDWFTSDCFYEAGIQCADTNDEHLEARYHPLSVEAHATWHPGKPLLGYKSLLHPRHNITHKPMMGQISKHSVSFHLKDKEPIHQDMGIRRHHAIVYKLCPKDTVLGKELMNFIQVKY